MWGRCILTELSHAFCRFLGCCFRPQDNSVCKLDWASEYEPRLRSLPSNPSASKVSETRVSTVRTGVIGFYRKKLPPSLHLAVFFHVTHQTEGQISESVPRKLSGSRVQIAARGEVLGRGPTRARSPPSMPTSQAPHTFLLPGSTSPFLIAPHWRRHAETQKMARP